MKICDRFQKYKTFNPKVPIYCVTPNEGRIIHRFFDTSPFSPSGRYMALFRMPYEDKLPEAGDFGEIVIIDLLEGQERSVATSYGFEQQMGANINWGENDNQIIYQDVDIKTWEPFAVRLNISTGEKKKIDYGVYHVSPDGKEACTGNPLCKKRTQLGYGVIVPEEQIPIVTILSEEEGLFVSDTKTGKGKLLLSMKQIYENCFCNEYINKYKNGECYLFHSKYSPDGKKIMFSTRWYPKWMHGKEEIINSDEIRFNIFTCNRDGSNLQLSVPQEYWLNGGHHTTWHPDSEHLTMNLKYKWEDMKIAKATLDGERIVRVFDDIIGTGHPTFHPNKRNIITDEYSFGKLAFKDGTTPIRWININTKKEEYIARIPTFSPYQDINMAMRVDPHPAWDKTNSYVALNAFINGTRRVLVMDMTKLI